VASEVGGSKPTGTNSSEGMTGIVLGLPDLVHSSSSRRHAGPTPAIRQSRVLTIRRSTRDQRQMSAVGLFIAGGSADDLREQRSHDACGAERRSP